MSYVEPVLQAVDATISKIGVDYQMAPGSIQAPPMFETGPEIARNRSWVPDAIKGHWEQVWKDIQGQGNKPLPAKQPNLQNGMRLVVESLGTIHVALQVLGDVTNQADNAIIAQQSADVEHINNAANAANAAIEAQINALRGQVGTASAGALAGAVAQSEAYTRSQIAALSKGLGTELSNLTHDVQHETNQRVAGDRSTLTQAEHYALDAASFIGALANNRMDGLAATEKSDVLNLNNRITSVNTKLEQDISGAISQSEGYATGLVNGLDVPGLRSEVNNLAGQTAQLAQEADQCLTPLCDSVTPNAKQLGKLGNLLKGLEGLGIAALLAGLVTTAIADPTDSARAIVDVAGWVPNFGTQLVADVTG